MLARSTIKSLLRTTRNFDASDSQIDVFAWLLNERGSAVVQAVAGSGKSTTILMALHLLPPSSSVLFCAFNKHIVNELKKRAPATVKVQTLNGLGYAALMRRAGGTMPINPHKTRRLVDDLVKREQELGNEEAAYNLRRMKWTLIKVVDLCKADGIAPPTLPFSMEPMTHDLWREYIVQHDLTFKKLGRLYQDPRLIEEEYNVVWLGRLTTMVLMEGFATRHEVIDFNDQLYLPIVEQLDLPAYDYVFVDEAQDLSAVQRAMLRSCCRRGRLIAVGDPKQAIYSFRGADCYSIKHIVDEFSCTVLPLSTTYRCPQRVVERAQVIVPHLETPPGAPLGIVGDKGLVHWTLFERGDLLLSRVNKVLVKMAYEFMRNDFPFKMLGNDLVDELSRILKSFDVVYIHDVGPKLSDWYDRAQRRAEKYGKRGSLAHYEDCFETLLYLITNTLQRTVAGLIDEFSSFFSDTPAEQCVTLSSIHRSKGLESHRVYAIDAWRIPIKYAQSKEQLEQEFNLLYVMVTRAKSELYFVDSEIPKEDIHPTTAQVMGLA